MSGKKHIVIAVLVGGAILFAMLFFAMLFLVERDLMLMKVEVEKNLIEVSGLKKKLRDCTENWENTSKKYTACLNRETERTKRLAKIDASNLARGKDHYDITAPGRVDQLICQAETNEWAARIEGLARVPPGTFKKIADGTPPKLTLAQRQRLVGTCDNNPPPPCTK